jgi:hypothetical protein
LLSNFLVLRNCSVISRHWEELELRNLPEGNQRNKTKRFRHRENALPATQFLSMMGKHSHAYKLDFFITCVSSEPRTSIRHIHVFFLIIFQ